MVKAKLLLVLGVLLAATPLAQAGFVWQAPGDDYIAFEAESFERIDDLDGDGVGWNLSADAAASGGEYLHATKNGPNDPVESEAVFQLQFTTAGSYQLYARYRLSTAGSGGQDSFFVPGDFGQPADVVRGTGTQDVYDWGYFASYTVDDPADLNNPLEFRLGVRESSFRLDRVVLTTTDYGSGTYISDADALLLDALGNSALVPEPTTCVLLLVGGLGLLVTSRRRRCD